ncbi:carnitine transporter [Tieghemiomyces parasiticus]|uniref:Carnitine transporter n=1 Tax=Tieghemiomyces parasiticus TaxID=78921 RepID=A0A9W8ACK1_9FUNG|nr:carnitine transporter [Tieghemiomyces parasiticus]
MAESQLSSVTNDSPDLIELSTGAIFPDPSTSPELAPLPLGTNTAAWKSFAAGGVGGTCLVLAGHPFDLLKVRLQTFTQGAVTAAVNLGKATSPPSLPATAKPPTVSALSLCRHIIRTEGLRGLYRGVVPPVLGAAPINAVSFWAYDLGLRSVRAFQEFLVPPPSATSSSLTAGWTRPLDKDSLGIPAIAAAGAFSSMFTVLLIGPGERIKVLLQVQGTPSAPADLSAASAAAKGGRLGAWAIVRHVYRTEGFRGLLRGTGAALLRDAPGCAVYFTAYETVRRNLATGGGPDGTDRLIPLPVTVLLAGGMAGIADWSVTMPIDTLKSRLQTAPPGTYPRGIRDVARHLIRTEGWRALYRGIGPVMLRAFPANAACFAGYETAMSLLNHVC